MILSHLYPIQDYVMTVLGGDDSICAIPMDLEVLDTSRTAAEVLNFELKPMSFSDSMYFSSRFIVLTRNGWITVADPVKLIVRLGRNDMQGHEHLEAIHDSWKSLHYMYRDREIRSKVDEAAVARYTKVLQLTS